MVSTNAIKHGFFSKFLLIQHPDGKESQEEYNDFYAEVRKHFQPVDFLEEYLSLIHISEPTRPY